MTDINRVVAALTAIAADRAEELGCHDTAMFLRGDLIVRAQHSLEDRLAGRRSTDDTEHDRQLRRLSSALNGLGNSDTTVLIAARLWGAGARSAPAMLVGLYWLSAGHSDDVLTEAVDDCETELVRAVDAWADYPERHRVTALALMADGTMHWERALAAALLLP